jgi:hypothetical protein
MADHLDVSELIKKAGGADAISAEANKRGMKLSRWAVYKWQRSGVPERYWDLFQSLTGVGPSQIYEANTLARSTAA